MAGFWKSTLRKVGPKSTDVGMPSEQSLGSSKQRPIPIHANSEPEGISLEYRQLQSMFGIRKKDWELELQSIDDKTGRLLDVMDIRLADGSKRKIFFDISSFYGKLP